jgi:glycosyltransferase involved in cell wall biosynthesis
MNTSFIIVTFNRDQLLKECIESLMKQIHDHDEVIIVDNGNSSLLNDLQKRSNKINIHKISRTTPAAARNYALKFAKNEWLCFLDDDTILPKNYLDKAHKIIQRFKPDIFGGPDQVPPQASEFENALSIALKSPLSTAHTRYRHKTTKRLTAGSESNLILCHLWIRNSWLSKRKFNSNLQRNEENVLIDDLIKAGAKALYSPQLWIYHHRKKNYASLYKAVSTSGYFRAKTIGINPSAQKIIFFTPSIFIGYLLFLLVFPTPMNAFPLFLYIMLNSITSLKEVLVMNKLHLFFSVSLIQFLIIIFYGCGFLKGLFASLSSFLFSRGFSFSRGA